MGRGRLAVAAIGAVLLLGGCGDDGDGTGERDPRPTPTDDLPVVADAEWCAGWQGLVQIQGMYVASPGPENKAAVLAAVDGLQALGAPESLDPAGYTEMTAVLDDVRASVDPSFTPSVVPSEPADVATGDHEHEHGHEDEDGDEDRGEGEGEDGHEADEAPFGAWLAEHCAN